MTLMTFSGLVTIYIRDYTAFETSLGAGSRLKSLSDSVKVRVARGRIDAQKTSGLGRAELRSRDYRLRMSELISLVCPLVWITLTFV